MENKKFELTGEFILFFGIKLFRIRALIDFGDVKSGDLGGYIARLFLAIPQIPDLLGSIRHVHSSSCRVIRHYPLRGKIKRRTFKSYLD